MPVRAFLISTSKLFVRIDDVRSLAPIQPAFGRHTLISPNKIKSFVFSYLKHATLSRGYCPCNLRRGGRRRRLERGGMAETDHLPGRHRSLRKGPIRRQRAWYHQPHGLGCGLSLTETVLRGVVAGYHRQAGLHPGHGLHGNLDLAGDREHGECIDGIFVPRLLAPQFLRSQPSLWH